MNRNVIGGLVPSARTRRRIALVGDPAPKNATWSAGAAAVKFADGDVRFACGMYANCTTAFWLSAPGAIV
ncbi:MAG TPA: hypothetical protein VGT98_02865, partial [Candidatus Elarobacter sp.]|nr:hypothetical protein [Candidatus Elarobacter sp.]